MRSLSLSHTRLEKKRTNVKQNHIAYDTRVGHSVQVTSFSLIRRRPLLHRVSTTVVNGEPFDEQLKQNKDH